MTSSRVVLITAPARRDNAGKLSNEIGLLLPAAPVRGIVKDPQTDRLAANGEMDPQAPDAEASAWMLSGGLPAPWQRAALAPPPGSAAWGSSASMNEN